MTTAQIPLTTIEEQSANHAGPFVSPRPLGLHPFSFSCSAGWAPTYPPPICHTPTSGCLQLPAPSPFRHWPKVAYGHCCLAS